MTTTPSLQPRRISGWRFWIPLALQVMLILAIPAQAAYIQATGQLVTLQVAPVDPYDFLRGYYVTLSYDISNTNNLKELPGWEELQTTQPSDGTTQSSSEASATVDRTDFYVVMEAPQALQAQPPKAWKAVAISRDRPTNLPDNQVALKGRYEYGWVQYGLESYYIPEDQKDAINTQINELQFPPNVPWQERPNNPPIVVEVKVGSAGHSVPLNLWLGDRKYHF
jgi:uncharacterized membrane-anchored protein